MSLWADEELKLEFYLIANGRLIEGRHQGYLTISRHADAMELKRALRRADMLQRPINAATLELWQINEIFDVDSSGYGPGSTFQLLRNNEIDMMSLGATHIKHFVPIGDYYYDVHARFMLIVDYTRAFQVGRGPPPGYEVLSAYFIDDLAEFREKYKYTPRLGGLGGTAYWSDAAMSPAIHLDDDYQTFVSRFGLVDELLEEVQKHGTLIIQSPAWTGKSALGQLVERALLRRSHAPRLRVFRLSLKWIYSFHRRGTRDTDQNSAHNHGHHDEYHFENWTMEEFFKRIMGSVSWSDFIQECKHIVTYLIIDDLETLYFGDGYHGAAEFWDPIQNSQPKGLYIIGLATNAYRWATGNASKQLLPPWHHLAPVIWNLDMLLFTNAEFDEYFARFLHWNFGWAVTKEEDAEKIKDYIWDKTLGHPGLGTCALDRLADHFRSRRKHGQAIPIAEIWLYLRSEEFLSDLHETPATRFSMDSITLIYPEEIALCEQVLQKGVVDVETPIATMGELNVDLEKSYLLTTAGPNNPKLEFTAPIVKDIFSQLINQWELVDSIWEPKSKEADKSIS